MDDFSQLFSSLMSDPKNLETLKSIASALSSGSGGGMPDFSSFAKPQETKKEAEASSPMPDFSALFGSLDPKFLSGAMSLLSSYNSVDNGKITLLTSLKPYLSPEKSARVDGAVRMLRILKVAGAIGITPSVFGRRS